MASREELLAEAYKRGILPPDMKAAYEEAMNRGLVSQPEPAGFFGTMFNEAKDAFTGDGRRDPEIDEYTTEFGDTDSVAGDLKTAFGMLMSATPEQQRNVLKNNLKGTVQFDEDEYGNLLMRKSSKEPWQYINAPGFSPRDVANTVAEGTTMLGATKGALSVVKPQSLVMRAGTAAGAAGGASMTMDKAAEATGSEEGVNLPRAGAATVFGFGAEIAAPVLSGAWRMMTRGKVKPDPVVARRILVDLGRNADEITDDMVEAFIQEARNAANPAHAAAAAEANSLPVKVPLTKGQITGRAQDQMFEDLAEKGAYGEGAETLMRGVANRRDAALRGNVGAIGERMGGPGVALDEAGGMGQHKLLEKSRSFKGKVDDAYAAARETYGEMPDDFAIRMADEISASIEDFAPHSKMAPVELKQFETIAPEGQPVTIKGLYDWRRRVSQLANNAKDRTEAAALTAMKKQFDKSLDTAIIEVLKGGDEKAVKAWRKAIALRKGYGKVFEGDDLVSELIQRQKGKTRLKVPPEAASNLIFGVSNTKLLARPELARELKKLRSVLGSKSAEWNAIKEEAFLRITGRAAAKAEFSGALLKTDLGKIQSRNTEVWHTLFDEGERTLINQFASVAARATVPVKGGANFSNTSVGISRLVQSLTDALFLGQRGKALLSRVFPAAYDGLQLGNAARSAAGSVPMRQIPPGAAGAAGATGGRLYYQPSSQ